MGSLGWLDFGARMYDSYLGRWISQDPMREKYPEMSQYVYCKNTLELFNSFFPYLRIMGSVLLIIFDPYSTFVSLRKKRPSVLPVGATQHL